MYRKWPILKSPSNFGRNILLIDIIQMWSASVQKSKMMARKDELSKAACEKISEDCNFALNFKFEQRNAVGSLLERNDILAVLPVGLEKSLIS